jgi:hypothetical protein
MNFYTLDKLISEISWNEDLPDEDFLPQKKSDPLRQAQKLVPQSPEFEKPKSDVELVDMTDEELGEELKDNLKKALYKATAVLNFKATQSDPNKIEDAIDEIMKLSQMYLSHLS